MNVSEEKRQRMEALYAAHRNDVFHLCLFYLRHAQQAEDAMQETFLKAWKKFDSFRGAGSEKAWLTAIAVNVCRDWLRTPWMHHEKNAQPLDESLLTAQEAKPEDVDVIRAVSGLPVKLREVIVLRYDQRLTVPEIAAALSISASGVNRRLHKARERLKPELWEVYFDA